MKNSQYVFSNRLLDFNYPKIMGIVNVTPDSFSDGGKYFSIDEAVDHALMLIDDGADIIDIGGESTRPGSDEVDVDEELKRTLPVIKNILKIKKDVIISIDTTKSKIAEEALNAGASIVNDVSGLTFDQRMIEIVMQFDAGVVIMHMKGNPKTMQQNPTYDDVVKDVFNFLKEQSDKAKIKGINKIIIDPGIGFGKRVEDNFELIKKLNEFKLLGYPIMIGLSRKSFIGKTLNKGINDRDVATIVLETASVLNSARIIRTHNVKYCNQLVKLVTHILQA
jgi:dihydropteroate synthase